MLLLAASRSIAVPAYPYPATVKQPDGTTLTTLLKGDEFYHYYTTADGIPIVKDENGIFNYAKIDSRGSKSDTRIKARDAALRSPAERNFIRELDKTPDFTTINKQKRVVRKAPAGTEVTSSSNQFPRTGSPRSLVILVNFSDLSFVTPNPNIAFTDKLNEEGYSKNGGTGSARDYFRDNSMGTFTPQFDVVGPYTLLKPYSYYGENDTNGQDKDPIQMIVDACQAANEAGVDFSIYDSDNDGIVDNIFVYYAGHNEAERAPANRVWPHRWGIYPTSMYSNGNYAGTVASVTFDGKRIEDYATTSELRGSSGTNMAGIGTFTHEFGHVLGLADMYATNNADHHTLSNWNIMDGGAYLNLGRTPPAYNAFERFQLGYLTPTLLNTPLNLMLNPLLTSNQAYLISPTETHNLNPASPAPTEFFLLENRQKTGWDAYLPGRGMLIYRINWNSTDWLYNQPNNSPNRMGVDIMEADGIANGNTLPGDPFPGTSNVKNYTPVLRNGTVLTQQPITYIQEQNGIISFQFKGGKSSPILNVSKYFTLFETNFGTPSASQFVTVEGKRLVSDIILSFAHSEHFEIKRETDPETAWAKVLTLSPAAVDSVVLPTNIQVRYNPAVPSYFLTHSNELTIRTDLAESLRFPLTGKSLAPPKATQAENVTYKSFIANWSPIPGATAYYLYVGQMEDDGTEISIGEDHWITATSDTLYNLISNKDYIYRVKASSFTRTDTGDTTSYSNTIQVRTLPYPYKKELRVMPLNNGNGSVNVFSPEEETENGVIHVFSSIGQRLRTVQIRGRDVVNIADLPKNIVLIIQSGNQRTKLILLN